MSKIHVLHETREGERRVAATPETIGKMIEAGFEVSVEPGAGSGAYLADSRFRDAGASVVGRPEALASADVVVGVEAPEPADVAAMKEGALLVALLSPHRNLELVRSLKERRVDAIAMELVPRITRAQTMDVLSSQASIAGYKAVVLAALRLPKYFPLMMTAAGTIKPARVVVMGAGVAGLQAVATARRLGAVVEVSDIREVVQEQVESLGGKFIELPELEGGEGEGGYAREVTPEFLRRQREIVTEHVAAADVVVTTALVPGKKAPVLITAEMVERMKPGSVIVDLAVAQGGNCEVSRAGEEVVHQGVLVLGPADLAASTSIDASALYARNVWALLESLRGEDGTLGLDPEDEVVDGALLVREGEVRHAPTREALAAS